MRRAATLAVFFVATAVAPLRAGDLYEERRTSFSSEAPKISIERPDAEWLFVDIAVQERDARSAGADLRGFRNLIARIYHPPTRATVSVFAFKTGGARLDLAALEAHARQDVERLEGGKVLEQARGALGGREVVRTDYQAVAEGVRGAAPNEVYVYSRIDALEPETGHSVVIVFEAPRERAKRALAGWTKILRKLKLA